MAPSDVSTESTVVTWSELGIGARLFRVAHGAWGALSLAGLGYIWWSALTRHRDRLLGASVTLLSVEGVALLIGRGDCPFGPFQTRLGDPVPLFELVLPPHAAKAAIPVLTATTAAGLTTLIVRGVESERSSRAARRSVFKRWFA